jgi:hypothetical protein
MKNSIQNTVVHIGGINERERAGGSIRADQSEWRNASESGYRGWQAYVIAFKNLR